jgi:hypothetical protein
VIHGSSCLDFYRCCTIRPPYQELGQNRRAKTIGLSSCVDVLESWRGRAGEATAKDRVGSRSLGVYIAHW